MEKYQKDLINTIKNNPNLTISLDTRPRGKSFFYHLYQNQLLDVPNYIILEDHWECPGRKRVDVVAKIRDWIKEQDEYHWEMDINTLNHYRFIISPELLTLLQLKFS